MSDYGIESDYGMSDYEPTRSEIEGNGNRDRYLAAMHAVGSGVSTKMGVDPEETSPKSLRVGINSAMVSNGALARLLISKGIITEEEYVSALADGAENEVRMYEDFLSKTLGSSITLR